MPLFQNVETIKEFKRCEPPRMGGQEAIIYTSENYHDLLRVTRLGQWDDQDVVDNRTVRFSLSTYFDIKFGKEGPPNYRTPAHEKLTGKLSLIAGNFGFNSEDAVCSITNKSNDYTPDFNSLQIVLIVMLKENKFIFADDLVFRKYAKNIETEQMKITREELFAELIELDFYKNYDAIVGPAKLALLALKDIIPTTPAISLGKRKLETESPQTPVTPHDEKHTPTSTRSTPRGSNVRSGLLSMFPPISPTISPNTTSTSSASRTDRGFISPNKFGNTVLANPLSSPTSSFETFASTLFPSSFLHDTAVPPLQLQSPPKSSALFSPLPQSPQIKELLGSLDIPTPDFTNIAPK